MRATQESTLSAGGSTVSSRPRSAGTEFARVFVKAFHSLAVLAFAAATFYLMYCAITGERTPLVWWSIAMIGVEAIVYLSFGRKCPLTILARNLGDEGGHDYLFEWLLGTKRIMYVSRTLAALGALAVLMIIVASIIG